MKLKCVLCSKNKAQRQCMLKNNSSICSSCCALMRSENCQSCKYYNSIKNYSFQKEARQKISALVDNLWLKMRKTEGELIPMMMQYVLQRFHPEVMIEAWDEFMGWPDDLPVPEQSEEFETIFLPWFLFNWKPEPYEAGSGLPPLPEKQIALCYLEDNRERLDDFQRQFIETACLLPYSFFVITDVVPGKSLALRDILLQREYVVMERLAAKSELKGSILFSRVLTLEDTSIMFGAAPLAIRPTHLNWFIDLREEWKKEWGQLDTEFLFEHDIELRDIYFDFKDMLNNPEIPLLQNTDGDLFEFIKIYYDLLCEPREAFDKLRPLRLDVPDEDALQEAVCRSDGTLQEISFSWMKKGNRQNPSWDNTIMGNLKIREKSLTIEVNSQKRAEKVQRLIKKHLNNGAVYKTSVIQSVESALRAQEKTSPLEKSESKRKQKEFEAQPEIRALLSEIQEKHWESWVDQKIPALGNKTPRQAAKTKIGREKLEALLLDFEMRPGPGAPDIKKLRDSLGL